jgi:hypothetical protein
LGFPLLSRHSLHDPDRLRVGKLLTGQFRRHTPLCTVTHMSRPMAAACVAVQGGAWSSECQEGLGERLRYQLLADTRSETVKIWAPFSQPLLRQAVAAAPGRARSKAVAIQSAPWEHYTGWVGLLHPGGTP